MARFYRKTSGCVCRCRHRIGTSTTTLTKALDVPTNRITAILNEQRGITADTALRLARLFGTAAEFWMSLQSSDDVKKAREAVAEEIERNVKPRELLAA